MEKSTKKRVRNVVLGMTSVALVAGITASLTLAYLTDTATKENVFSGTPGITALLLEPDFDGDMDGNRNNNITDGKITTADEGAPTLPEGEDWGYNDALDYMPGDVINKNPYVKNTSSDKPVYVRLVAKYYVDDTEVSYSDFTKFATPENNSIAGFNTTNWETDDYVNFYYVDGGNLKTVSANGQTEELFTDVKIDSALTISGGKVVKNGTTVTTGESDTEYSSLPKLEIKLVAAIVAADGTDSYGNVGDTYSTENDFYKAALDSVAVSFS